MWTTLGMWVIKNCGIYILIFIVGFIACWKLNTWWHRNDDNSPTITATIKEIKSPTQYEIEAGLAGRKTRLVSLYGLQISQQAPASDLVASKVKVGDSVQIVVEEGRRRLSDIVGEVITSDGTNVNLELIRLGFAKPTCDDKEFLAAEKEAKKNRVGIWNTGKHGWFNEHENTDNPFGTDDWTTKEEK